MYILIFGTPTTGFQFKGLFNTVSEAEEYGEREHPNYEWWAAAIDIVNSKDLDININVVTADIIPVNANKCSCRHEWWQHNRNVYGTYVCTQCQCRNTTGPNV